jgi:hypothetical protein
MTEREEKTKALEVISTMAVYNETLHRIMEERDAIQKRYSITDSRFNLLVKMIMASKSLDTLDREIISSFIDSWKLDDIEKNKHPDELD